MSQDHVDVVRGLFAALESQDWEAALRVFDPEVEWSPTEGTFHGVDGVVTSLVEWLEPWDEHHIEAEEFTEAGNEILAVIHLTGRAERGSRIEMDQRFFSSMPCATGRSLEWSNF